MTARCVEAVASILDQRNPSMVERYLWRLIDALADERAASDRLGVQLEDTVGLMAHHRHNNDEWHRGETILEHTINVLEDLEYVCGRYSCGERQKRVLFLVGLLHDVGKAFTYVRGAEGNATFYDHPEVSTRIAEELLSCVQHVDPEEYRRVVDTVRLHDIAAQLVMARRQSRGRLHYLNRLRREWLYTSGHLDDLVLFTKADMGRAKIRHSLFVELEAVMADLQRVERERENEERLRAARRSPTMATVEAVRAILESRAPGLVELLPDVRAVKRTLGTHGNYEVLRMIERREREGV